MRLRRFFVVLVVLSAFVQGLTVTPAAAAAPLTILMPSYFVAIGGTPKPVSGVIATDAFGTTNSTTNSVTVILQASGGAFSMSTTTGLTFDSPTANGNRVVSFSGTTSAVNAGLATLSYVPSSTLSGSITLTGTVMPGAMRYNIANGHFYEVINNGSDISWTAAKAAAEAKTYNGMQGYLATVTSASESAIVSPGSGQRAWLGATDAAIEGTWNWVSGPENGVTFYVQGTGPIGGAYTNWKSGEPNNSGGIENYMETDETGQWNDATATQSNRLRYVVEYGGMPGDTFMPISGNLRYNSENGHFYELINDGSNPLWTSARSKALARSVNGVQGYLTNVTSANEEAFLEAGVSSISAWIGGSDDPSVGASENNWRWIDGPEAGTVFSIGSSPTPGSFTKWASGEPNNSGGNENFLSIASNGSPYGWNDNRGSNALQAFVVEYGNAPIVLPSSTTASQASVVKASGGNATVNVSIPPTFNVTVAGRASACNGSTPTTTATANSISLLNLNSATVASAAQDITVATNSAGGFIVFLRGTSPVGTRAFNDVAGTVAMPAAFGSGERFGFTTNDSSLAGGTPDRFTNGGPLWAAIPAADTAVIDAATTGSFTQCLAYQIATSPATPAGTYGSALIYSAVPSF